MKKKQKIKSQCSSAASVTEVCTIICMAKETTTITSRLHFKLGFQHKINLQFFSCPHSLNINTQNTGVSDKQRFEATLSLSPDSSARQPIGCVNPASYHHVATLHF